MTPAPHSALAFRHADSSATGAQLRLPAALEFPQCIAPFLCGMFLCIGCIRLVATLRHTCARLLFLHAS
jgi:hypothetical protein